LGLYFLGRLSANWDGSLRKNILNKNDTFDLVYDVNEFKEVFDFVKHGFNFTDEFADELLNLILSCQENTPIAAVNRTDGKVDIALLIIYQGTTDDGQRQVLNLSSWYAAPERRGPTVFSFIKSLLAQLQHYIITNYTPNNTVSSVLKLFGFKPMHVSMLQGGLLKQSPYIRFNVFRALKAGKRTQLIPLISNGKKETLRYSIHPRKIMGINCSIMNVFQMDNKNWPPNLWNVLRIMIRHRAPMLILYYIEKTQSKNEAKWLIYDAIDDTRFIPPLASELSVIKY
tara:strand:+ start:549 stop:1403 length:855 start_codon:yes stop_codon:yes gene_type:complete